MNNIIKNFIIAALLMMAFGHAYAAQPDDFQSISNQYGTLKIDNQLTKYVSNDFSSLLIPKSEFLGYIGDHYRRLNIHFTSVAKDKQDPTVYEVIGYSTVMKNKNDFQGIIKLSEIREYQTMHYGVDDEKKNDGIKSQGVLLGHYSFSENPKQSDSGKFEGTVILFWFMDKNGVIQYDDIESYSDGYKNNQYIGTWTPYGKESHKIANWGEYRIPFAGDLDMGAAEFSPDKKYYNQGWSNYKSQ